MDDINLIKRIREGELAAVRLLVENNKNLVWHIILNMTGKNDDSEDIFQEVFLQVFKSCRRFKGTSKLSTWIGSIAHHVCVDYLRRKKREIDLFNHIENPACEAIPDEQEWDDFGNKDLIRWVHAAIADLPPAYRTVITLYHLDECSYCDISEITGMPEGTVKSYISRGRSLLREMLGKVSGTPLKIQ